MSGRLARMESVRKLQELKRESSNVVNFSQRLGQCCGLTGSIGIVFLTIVFVLIVIGLGFAKLIMGGIYFHNCPLQPLIPIWLIVSATVNFLYNGACKRKQEGIGRIVFAIFVSFFTIVWLILGTVWIIQANQAIKNCDALIGTTKEEPVLPGGLNQTNITTSSTLSPTDTCERCDMRLFNFAYVVVMLEWSFVLIVVVLAFFCCCCYLIMHLNALNED